MMPNHWHLLVWPERDGKLMAFVQRLTVTHVRRWQQIADMRAWVTYTNVDTNRSLWKVPAIKESSRHRDRLNGGDCSIAPVGSR